MGLHDMSIGDNLLGSSLFNYVLIADVIRTIMLPRDGDAFLGRAQTSVRTPFTTSRATSPCHEAREYTKPGS